MSRSAHMMLQVFNVGEKTDMWAHLDCWTLGCSLWRDMEERLLIKNNVNMD
jgi:hypothetical protein